MTRKKNKFMTVVFSFIPGAGQMFMGFMKLGTSFMSLFSFIILLSAWLNLARLQLCCR